MVDCGFEHPSEVQHECIPQAVLGMDVICQAKSGMGKTAVFVLATLHQLTPVDGEVGVLVLCHTRELAFQIAHEYSRFSKYLPSTKTAVFYGGVNIQLNRRVLKDDCPHVVVGTPGRILQLSREKTLKLDKVKVRGGIGVCVCVCVSPNFCYFIFFLLLTHAKNPHFLPSFKNNNKKKKK